MLEFLKHFGVGVGGDAAACNFKLEVWCVYYVTAPNELDVFIIYNMALLTSNPPHLLTFNRTHTRGHFMDY